MNRIRIYLYTSVIGGYFDKEFKKNTKQLFEKIKTNNFDIYISDISVFELEHTPD